MFGPKEKKFKRNQTQKCSFQVQIKKKKSIKRTDHWIIFPIKNFDGYFWKILNQTHDAKKIENKVFYIKKKFLRLKAIV